MRNLISAGSVLRNGVEIARMLIERESRTIAQRLVLPGRTSVETNCTEEMSRFHQK